MMTISFDGIVIYILVFIRMGAMLIFNPIFNRRNVNSFIRIAFSIILTFIIVPTINQQIAINGTFEFITSIIYQIFIGFCFGFIFQIFYYMLFFVGDLLDFEFGISAAKVFDPASNINSSLSGLHLNILFGLLFFISNAHLTIIKLFCESYFYVPIDRFFNFKDLALFMISLFSSVFILALKLFLPFLIVQFVLEICMGILMRLIPQVHVFIINIQLKIFVGILLLILFSDPVGEFVDRYIVLMFDKMSLLFNL